ncbi:MAG: hypothetical protein HY898_15295 [Deltaproteobacteria bacterium]|nr:hypothetical protein [Deltaproteobacteria bacterium]
MRLRTCVILSTTLVALPTPASAVDFDALGQASFTKDALFTLDFEGTLPTGLDPQPSQPLQGKQAARIAAGKVVALPAMTLSGQHALAATAFARGGPANGYLVVRYAAASKLPDVIVPLFPSGRVTSDGWYELRSSGFSVDASTIDSAFVYIQNLAVDPVDIDAVEVVDAGTYQEPIACAPPTDAVCGAARVCAAGICREGAAAVPPLPSTDAERAKVGALFTNQLDLFFGGLKTRQLYLPKALAETGKMAAQKEAWAYWQQLLRAMHALHDGHTFGYIGYSPHHTTAACFVEGDGDLTHGVAPKDPTYPDILVSHALSDAGLLPGDRIVSVNGMHPVAFVRSLVGLYSGGFLGCDDDSHSYAAQSLASAIPTYASTVTVVSCPGGVCEAPKTIPASALKAVPGGSINCDHRIGFHFATDNPDPATHMLPSFVLHGKLAATLDPEALFGAAFDSFYPEGTSNPFLPLVDMAKSEALGVVIDHRPGGGGYGNYASLVTEPFRLKTALSVSVAPQAYRYDPAFDQAKGKAIFDAFKDTEGFIVGSATPKPGLKGAVLIANGESAGDFFPFGMKGPKNIRLFGRRTQGAFSTAYYLAFGPMLWGFGSGDTFRADGSSMIGTGELPDEDLLPKQSDVVKGVDTVYERALDWLRTCSDCAGEVP